MNIKTEPSEIQTTSLGPLHVTNSENETIASDIEIKEEFDNNEEISKCQEAVMKDSSSSEKSKDDIESKKIEAGEGSSNELKCQMCSKKFNNRNIYNEHLRFEALKAEISEKKKEGEDVVFRYKCFFCGDLFKSERMLGVHVDAYHDFRCSWCGTRRQRFVSEKTFHTHVSKCHSRGGNPGKRFSGKRDMFVFQCKICEVEFPQKITLKAHLTIAHKKQLHDKFILHVYGRYYDNRGNIYKSGLKSKGMKCQCDICELYFFHQDALSKHIIDVHKECQTCGAYFMDMTQLQKHMVEIHKENPDEEISKPHETIAPDIEIKEELIDNNEEEETPEFILP